MTTSSISGNNSNGDADLLGNDMDRLMESIQQLRAHSRRTRTVGVWAFSCWVILLSGSAIIVVAPTANMPQSLIGLVMVWLLLLGHLYYFDLKRRFCYALADQVSRAMQKLIHRPTVTNALIEDASWSILKARAATDFPLIPGNYGPLISLLTGLVAAVVVGLLRQA